MNAWKRSWKNTSHTRGKSFIKKVNHRKNRKLGKNLSTDIIRLNERDVG